MTAILGCLGCMLLGLAIGHTVDRSDKKASRAEVDAWNAHVADAIGVTR